MVECVWIWGEGGSGCIDLVMRGCDDRVYYRQDIETSTSDTSINT